MAFSREATADPPDATVPELGSPDPMAISLDPRLSYLINPGSVGQPRDGDPRAAYAVLDADVVRTHQEFGTPTTRT